jgi:hypothetical protein
MTNQPARSVVLPGWDGAGAPGGPSEAEPGAGGAGPGAAQRRRLILDTADFGSQARHARPLRPELAAALDVHRSPSSSGDCWWQGAAAVVRPRCCTSLLYGRAVIPCLQSTPRLSRAVADLGIGSSVNPSQTGSVGSRCGQDWWSASRSAGVARLNRQVPVPDNAVRHVWVAARAGPTSFR